MHGYFFNQYIYFIYSIYSATFFVSLAPAISASLSVTPPALRPAAITFVYNFRGQHNYLSRRLRVAPSFLESRII